MPLLIFICNFSVVSAMALEVNIDPNARTAENEFEFEAGHWVGKSEWSADGEFDSCMVAEHNDNDEMLILRLDQNNILTLGIFQKIWKRKLYAGLSVIIVVDHHTPIIGMGILYSDDILMIYFRDKENALSEIGGGKMMLVSVGRQSVYFNLDFSDQAISYLRECVVRGLGGKI